MQSQKKALYSSEITMSKCYLHFDCKRTVLLAMPTIFVCCGVTFCDGGDIIRNIYASTSPLYNKVII